MDVGDLFEQLSFGELSNLFIGLEGEGGVRPEKKANIIAAANDGLTRLFSRFPILEKELIVECRVDTTYYDLSVEHSMTTGTASVSNHLFIRDREEAPYTGDLIRILSVYDSKVGLLPLNDDENRHSVFTPKPKQLLVPHPDGKVLSVIYQANHPRLSPDVDDDYIDLPDVLEEALKTFVAGKVYSGMNGQENLGKSQALMADFESICQLVEDRDLIGSSTSTTNIRFEKRGFV
jgi:hypothetical protein